MQIFLIKPFSICLFKNTSLKFLEMLWKVHPIILKMFLTNPSSALQKHCENKYDSRENINCWQILRHKSIINVCESSRGDRPNIFFSLLGAFRVTPIKKLPQQDPKLVIRKCFSFNANTVRGNLSEPFFSETQSSTGAVESEPSYRVDLKAFWCVKNFFWYTSKKE